MNSADGPRAALVTGVSSGIGAGIAARLLADGWRVYGVSRRRPTLEHDRLSWIAADLAARDDLAAIVEAVPELSAVVHAAGLQHSARLGDLDSDHGAQMWRIHVDAVSSLVNLLVGRLSDGARIVLIGSRTAVGVAGKSQYAATKAAQLGLARSWAIELAPRQITVNVVAPGPTDTPMLEDPARAATPVQLPPMGRLVDPREIADLVGFLLGPSGRSITGQQLVVCAGASL